MEVPSSKILQTVNYKMFTNMPGNRAINPRHVRQLQTKMTANGNLTQHFPIVVNEKMEVIDGQHRLQALKELNWPVFYRIEKYLTVATVRNINQATMNWSWFDYAVSYAELGNDNYQRFLDLANEFGFTFGILLAYCGSPQESKSKGNNSFKEGDFKLSRQSYKEAEKDLLEYQKLSEAAKHGSNVFARVLLRCMHHPNYDSERMFKRLSKHGKNMPSFISETDTFRAIEDIYNYRMNDNEKVRLF